MDISTAVVLVYETYGHRPSSVAESRADAADEANDLLKALQEDHEIDSRGKAHGHTWFTAWKPRGHSDIGPDAGGPRLTRHGADDARGARY